MNAPRYQWQPTTAQIAADAGIEPKDVIRFDHNTSPFPTGWAPAVVAEPAGHLNEYPGADYRTLRAAAAAAADVDVDRVAVGAGADELILLIGRALLGPGRRAVWSGPTYPLYRIASAQAGAEWDEIERIGPDFRLPVDELIDAARDADVVFLCEPNNPTGDRSPDDAIATIVAATDGVVVIDAAYAEFAGDRWGSVVKRHHNLVVLHTLSKAYGLAGARVGYALAHPDFVDAIDGVRPPGSIASLSVELAVAALGEPERMQRTVVAIGAERDLLADRLAELGLRVLPSLANFLLCEVGPAAHDLAGAAMAEGLVFRSYPKGPLTDHLRFTVRTASEHDRLIDFLGRHLR